MVDQSQLADGTTSAEIYPAERHVEQWKAEAEDRGESLSQYVIHRVNEARAAEALDDSTAADESQIEQLEAKVAALEDELERERAKNAGRPAVDDPDIVKQFLDTKTKAFEQIVREIVESGVLEELVAGRIEDQLYHLAAQGEVAYNRSGEGWHLTEDGEEVNE